MNENHRTPPRARQSVAGARSASERDYPSAKAPDVLRPLQTVPDGSIVPGYPPAPIYANTQPQVMPIDQTPTESKVLESPDQSKEPSSQAIEIIRYSSQPINKHSECPHLVQNTMQTHKAKISALTSLEEATLLKNILCDPNDMISRRILEIHYENEEYIYNNI